MLERLMVLRSFLTVAEYFLRDSPQPGGRVVEKGESRGDLERTREWLASAAEKIAASLAEMPPGAVTLTHEESIALATVFEVLIEIHGDALFSRLAESWSRPSGHELEYVYRVAMQGLREQNTIAIKRWHELHPEG